MDSHIILSDTELYAIIDLVKNASRTEVFRSLKSGNRLRGLRIIIREKHINRVFKEIAMQDEICDDIPLDEVRHIFPDDSGGSTALPQMDNEYITTFAQLFVEDHMTSPDMRSGIIVLLEELENSALPEALWGQALKQIGTLMS